MKKFKMFVKSLYEKMRAYWKKQLCAFYKIVHDFVMTSEPGTLSETRQEKSLEEITKLFVPSYIFALLIGLFICLLSSFSTKHGLFLSVLFAVSSVLLTLFSIVYAKRATLPSRAGQFEKLTKKTIFILSVYIFCTILSILASANNENILPYLKENLGFSFFCTVVITFATLVPEYVFWTIIPSYQKCRNEFSLTSSSSTKESNMNL
ncbi:MAG: hypothetical protein LBU39_07745 [Desulfobulbaceae bacterium]|nr:hypothetical protein [Desulfobulbaceae bacterium]